MPPAVFSSASRRRTTTRSCKGRCHVVSFLLLPAGFAKVRWNSRQTIRENALKHSSMPSANKLTGGNIAPVACQGSDCRIDNLTSERMRTINANGSALCCGSCRLTPTLMRGSSKPSVRGTTDQMPLNIECVVDRRMNRDKALSRSGRFEALHLSLSSSNRLVRVLRAVVGTQSLPMQSRKANFSKRRAIGSSLSVTITLGTKT